MIRVGVVGATGYAGAEVVRIIAGHPQVELALLTSRQYAGTALSDIFPAFSGVVDQLCREYDADSVCDRCDVVFLALPHKVSMAVAPELVSRGRRVIDLSADFRFRDLSRYESHYQPHSAPQLLENAVYGLCEVHTERIRQARLVGNPGCYPTSVLLPLLPLVRAGLIDVDTIVADAKSGVSGAGRGLSLATHFCEVNESFKAYKVGGHRHTPEMEEQLSLAADRDVRITFTPHLIPATRGMLTTVYAHVKADLTTQVVRDCLGEAYQGRSFVRICGTGRFPDTLHVRGTNFCDIGLHVDERTGRLILISAIDNLVKGAAGQAVQNMNLMLGLPETAGLAQIPYPL